jgi:mRNA interferase MazF
MTPPMTPFEFGDVILVPFPFTDHTTTKQRPAVVISSSAYHARRPDLVLMAVTSQRRASAWGDVEINAWRAAGLLKPSAVKPVIATIEQNWVIKRLGRLEAVDQQAVRVHLKLILG